MFAQGQKRYKNNKTHHKFSLFLSITHKSQQDPCHYQQHQIGDRCMVAFNNQSTLPYINKDKTHSLIPTKQIEHHYHQDLSFIFQILVNHDKQSTFGQIRFLNPPSLITNYPFQSHPTNILLHKYSPTPIYQYSYSNSQYNQLFIVCDQNYRILDVHPNTSHLNTIHNAYSQIPQFCQICHRQQTVNQQQFSFLQCACYMQTNYVHYQCANIRFRQQVKVHYQSSNFIQILMKCAQCQKCEEFLPLLFKKANNKICTYFDIEIPYEQFIVVQKMCVLGDKNRNIFKPQYNPEQSQNFKIDCFGEQINFLRHKKGVIVNKYSSKNEIWIKNTVPNSFDTHAKLKKGQYQYHFQLRNSH